MACKWRAGVTEQAPEALALMLPLPCSVALDQTLTLTGAKPPLPNEVTLAHCPKSCKGK